MGSFRGLCGALGKFRKFWKNVNRGNRALLPLTRCALMCAEAFPWRCHCSLIADALVVRGVRWEDIIDTHGRKPHSLTPWAQAEGVRIFYPAQQGRLI